MCRGAASPVTPGTVWPRLLTPMLPSGCGAGAEPDVAHRDAAAGELRVHHQAGEAAAAADERDPQAAEQEQVGPGAARGPPQPLDPSGRLVSPTPAVRLHFGGA